MLFSSNITVHRIMKGSKKEFTVIFVYLFVVVSYLASGNTVDYLDSLGKSLADRLSHPGKNCDYLVRDLFDYYNHLDEMYNNITTGEEEVKKDVLDMVQEFTECGGPPHLNIEVDFDKFLFNVYKNDKDVQMIYKALNYNRESWKKLKTIYETHAHI